jgi:hypothetical protein
VNPAVTVGVFAAGKMDVREGRLLHLLPAPRGLLAAYALKWVLGGAVGHLGAGILAANLQAWGLDPFGQPGRGLSLSKRSSASFSPTPSSTPQLG